MEKRLVNIDGPPGTGKSRVLNNMFIAACQEFGPKRVGAVTFTRSGAEVLRSRAGEALHLGKGYETLRKALPSVGTVHSIIWRMLGGPTLVSGANLTGFCDYVKMPKVRGVPESVDDVDGYFVPEDTGQANSPGVGMMMKVLSASRHRGVSLAQVVPELVPPTIQGMYRPEWFEAMAKRYSEWKHDMKLMDYDDLLDAGRVLRLPVDVLLCDEVQDNSKLLWEVMDAWAGPTRLAVFAGDPFQAIYQFSGADPELFMFHAGEWATLPVSHRLSDEASRYSHDVLKAAGWRLNTEPIKGAGGRAVDGTTLYLARTHALVERVADSLMDEGTPFDVIRGRGPFASVGATAYRLIRTLAEGGTISTGQLPAILNAAATGYLPRGTRAYVERLARGDRPVEWQEANAILKLDGFTYKSERIYSYMKEVEARHGVRGLHSRPKTKVGTVHAAKGMEADDVILIEDWGVLPSKIARSYGAPAKREACVAYVAVTRHRVSLTLRNLSECPTYPFPLQKVERGHSKVGNTPGR